MMAVVFGAQGAGQFFSFSPDITKATSATAHVTRLLEHQPDIDVWSDEGQKVERLEGGHIEFRNVHFTYPTRYLIKSSADFGYRIPDNSNSRPDVPVLRGLNLDVKSGQYVALVGASGCGKSTTVALIERFYDPIAGQVLVDGVPISEYNLSEYRQSISIVSQEPTYHPPGTL
jgi:ATP-binding cassette, subfamily B (MDR/TAP), member 1